jgi:hypothetical protein
MASCFHSLDRSNLKNKLTLGLKFIFHAFFYSEIPLESLFMIKSLKTLSAKIVILLKIGIS